MTAMTLERFDADFGAQNFEMKMPAFDGMRELSFDELDAIYGGLSKTFVVSAGAFLGGALGFSVGAFIGAGTPASGFTSLAGGAVGTGAGAFVAEKAFDFFAG